VAASKVRSLDQPWHSASKEINAPIETSERMVTDGAAPANDAG
jgi:hypothetical protein